MRKLFFSHLSSFVSLRLIPWILWLFEILLLSSRFILISNEIMWKVRMKWDFEFQVLLITHRTNLLIQRLTTLRNLITRLTSGALVLDIELGESGREKKFNFCFDNVNQFYCIWILSNYITSSIPQQHLFSHSFFFFITETCSAFVIYTYSFSRSLILRFIFFFIWNTINIRWQWYRASYTHEFLFWLIQY